MGGWEGGGERGLGSTDARRRKVGVVGGGDGWLGVCLKNRVERVGISCDV